MMSDMRKMIELNASCFKSEKLLAMEKIRTYNGSK